MKKTYNINMAGRVFTIDDDAYALLKDYLDTLGHAFRDTENSEITSDIESRISEIFEMRRMEGVNVVTLQDVETVITRIGRPEELIGETINAEEQVADGIDVDAEAKTSERPSAPPPPVQESVRTRKRLFRDSRNGILGGVCAGLAAYFNIDPTWVRLIAVALCFVSFSTLGLVYLILWIVLPDANTPLERMQMSGIQPTLGNIGQNVKDFFSNDRRREEIMNDMRGGTVNVANGMAEFFGAVGRILLILLFIVAVPLEVALGIGLLGCIFALIMMGTAWGWTLLNGNILRDWAYDDAFLGILTAIGCIIMVAVPLWTLIRCASLSGNTRSMRKSELVTMLIIWIIGIALGAFSGGLLMVRENAIPAIFN